jgi:hypothetical protein
MGREKGLVFLHSRFSDFSGSQYLTGFFTGFLKMPVPLQGASKMRWPWPVAGPRRVTALLSERLDGGHDALGDAVVVVLGLGGLEFVG